MKIDLFELFVKYAIKNKKIKKINGCIDPSEFQTVAFLTNTAIGDTLFNTPVFRAFKESFPTKKTVGLFNPANLSLFKTNPHIDTFLSFDGKWNTFFKTLKTLKQEKPDIVFILHSNEPQATPLAVLCGAKYVIKIPNDKNAYASFHSNPKIAQNLDKHGIFDRLKQLEYINIGASNPTLELFLKPEWVQTIDTFLNMNAIADDDILIGFQVGASTKSRMWFEDKWIELGKRLLEINPKIKIILTGSPAEKKLTEPIKKALQSNHVFDCAGMFPLGSAAALIGKLNLLITPDTGPLHIATALKTPTIGLFAVADPKNSNACYDTPIHPFIKKPKTCVPCVAKRCTYQKCMLQIEPDEIIETIHRYTLL